MKTIVCHGDSLTEGAEVDQSDTWPALAEKELNIRIVNSGISGWVVCCIHRPTATTESILEGLVIMVGWRAASTSVRPTASNS